MTNFKNMMKVSKIKEAPGMYFEVKFIIGHGDSYAIKNMKISLDHPEIIDEFTDVLLGILKIHKNDHRNRKEIETLKKIPNFSKFFTAVDSEESEECSHISAPIEWVYDDNWDCLSDYDSVKIYMVTENEKIEYQLEKKKHAKI